MTAAQMGRVVMLIAPGLPEWCGDGGDASST